MDSKNNLCVIGQYSDTLFLNITPNSEETESNGKFNVYIFKINQTIETSLVDKGHIEIKTYPNPTNKFYNIVLKNKSSSAEIRIYDSTGKICKSDILKHQKSSIDISTLKNGLYFIQIELSSGEIINTKLQITK